MSRDPIEDWIDKAIDADPVELDIDEFDEPSGPPLSPEEIEAARLSLARWQIPDAFKAEVDALCARCVSKNWFNRPQLKFLHDAFVLARFARHRRVDEVRLAEPSAQWPDGFVRIAGKTHNIEVTSTHGGRKLGEEYREVKGPTMDPVEDWVARGESISEVPGRDPKREKQEALRQPMLAGRVSKHQRIRHPSKGNGGRYRRGQGALRVLVRSYIRALEGASLLECRTLVTS
jgi:hypothetical protein